MPEATAVATRSRRVIGTYPVDSGTVIFANDGRFPASEDDAFIHRLGSGWASSVTGYGDGRYEVVLVEEGNEVIGVETVFGFPEAEDEADETWGPAPDRPAAAEEGSPAHDRWLADRRAWEADHRAAYDAAWDRLLPAADPAARLAPLVIGRLEVTGPVGIGDPCTGPFVEVDVPAGSYEVISWDDAGTPLRFGLYCSTDGASGS